MAAVFAWNVAISLILFKTVKAVVGLRVKPEEEIEGLDIGEHGMSAYGDFVMRPSGALKTAKDIVPNIDLN